MVSLLPCARWAQRAPLTAVGGILTASPHRQAHTAKPNSPATNRDAGRGRAKPSDPQEQAQACVWRPPLAPAIGDGLRLPPSRAPARRGSASPHGSISLLLAWLYSLFMAAIMYPFSIPLRCALCIML